MFSSMGLWAAFPKADAKLSIGTWSACLKQAHKQLCCNVDNYTEIAYIHLVFILFCSKYIVLITV